MIAVGASMLVVGASGATLLCLLLAARQISRPSAGAFQRVERLLAEEGLDSRPARPTPFQLLPSLGRLLHRLGTRVAPDAADDTRAPRGLRDRLVQAGWRQSSALPIFMACKLVLMLAAGTFVGFSSYAWFGGALPSYAWGLAAGLLGYIAPNVYLSHRLRTRQAAVDRELPDVLDLLVVCTQAGLGLDAAIDRVADATRRTCPTVARELATMAIESQIGRPRQDVLRNLARRTGTESTRSLAAILIQSDRFGTSVAQALSTTADALRVARHLRAEESAGKAAVKIIFPLVLCIFPAIFVVVAGPALIQLAGTLLPLLSR